MVFSPVLILNLDNLDGLTIYMDDVNKREIIPDEYFLNFCDGCFRMTDLFRHKILGQDLVPDIVRNRFNWTLSHYLKTGDRDQLDTGHVGEINLLNRKHGFKEE